MDASVSLKIAETAELQPLAWAWMTVPLRQPVVHRFATTIPSASRTAQATRSMN
jgi:hypothetical protein